MSGITKHLRFVLVIITGSKEAARDNYPVTYDPTDPKSIPPKLQLLNDTYINLSGKSKTEFLVIYSYTSFEDVTSATYVSLFQNDKGKARRISTLKLFDAKDIKELWREQDVVYNDKTQQEGESIIILHKLVKDK
ncbi:hypothetical protein [Brevibacillus laterosporus]|uniref:hypothetical protein n=1 Tax=Brevibacillus laterosporus TaxID=1465 RepID=UPI00055469E8|nr:hypothetical protein [Brevibacillus laterosporus]